MSKKEELYIKKSNGQLLKIGRFHHLSQLVYDNLDKITIKERDFDILPIDWDIVLKETYLNPKTKSLQIWYDSNRLFITLKLRENE